MGISSYLLLQNYVSKINLDDGKKAESIETRAKGIHQDEADGDGMKLYSEGDAKVSEESVVSVDLQNASSDSYPNTAEQESENLLNEEIEDNIAEKSETPDNHDIINVLLIGTDRRSSKERGRSDSMVLMTLNKKTKNNHYYLFLT